MIANFKIKIHFVNDTYQELHFDDTKELVDQLFADDCGAPPARFILEALDDEGKPVQIVVPYGKYDKVKVIR